MRRILIKDKDGNFVMVNIPSINSDIAWDGGSPVETPTTCVTLKYMDDGYTVEGYVESPCS